ncbi:MAG: hypothetical protein IV090_05965 [Candidatus Sericytochromatia bacterium]|nr:hypothetical protein [Candidatus Sericytochromatia bacterium]
MFERLNSATFRGFALFNDLLLFGLLVMFLPLPLETPSRMGLGLGLLLLLEVSWGKTPGSLLAGYGTELDDLSWFERGLWLGICCLKLVCFGLSCVVGWGVLQVTALFNKEAISVWNQPVILGLALALFLILSVLGSNLLGYLLIEHLEDGLSIERDHFAYAKDWGLFLSFLPLLGILLYSSLQPPYLNHHGDKIGSVMANMHNLATMLETYASDWQGVYPESLKTLEQEAKQTENPYWKEIVNPYTSLSGSPNTLANEKELPQAGIKYRGFVSFEVPAADLYRKYTIYGYDKHGKKITYKDKLYILSNAWD